MATAISPCTTCNKPTPHKTPGVATKECEPDGRVYQTMEFAVCGTSTKVYFTESTNEFQEHLDTPDDSDA